MSEANVTGPSELATFVARLATDSRLYERYANDPEGAMEEAGLTDYEKGLLRDGHWQAIWEAFGWQLPHPMVQHGSGSSSG